MTVIPDGSPDPPGGGAAVTVIAALPLIPSLVAVTVADPTTIPKTRPLLELTEAMLMVPLDHVTTRPVSTLPLASRVTAVS
jgi:hypothetical protein